MKKWMIMIKETMKEYKDLDMKIIDIKIKMHMIQKMSLQMKILIAGKTKSININKKNLHII